MDFSPWIFPNLMLHFKETSLIQWSVVSSCIFNLHNELSLRSSLYHQSMSHCYFQTQDYHLELLLQLGFPLPRQKHLDIQAQRIGQELHLRLVQVPSWKAAMISCRIFIYLPLRKLLCFHRMQGYLSWATHVFRIAVWTNSYPLQSQSTCWKSTNTNLWKW